MKYKEVNIKNGMPLVYQAVGRLKMEISSAKVTKTKVMKIIHGYGSSGQGGKIKQGVLRLLNDYMRNKTIKCFVKGEDWSIFDNTSRNILDKFPVMKKDEDLDRKNYGVTIVLL